MTDSPVALKNRYALTFESSLGIDSFLVQSISSLRFDGLKKEWDPVCIDFIECVDLSPFMRLVEMTQKKSRFPIKLQFLDGPGREGKTIYFAKYQIQEVSQEGLTYGSNEVLISHLIILPETVTFTETEQKKV